MLAAAVTAPVWFGWFSLAFSSLVVSERTT